MGQFSNSFPKDFSYLCEYAIRCALSCSFCEYPFIFECLHCSPSCFDPDSLLLAYLWLGLSWIDCISPKKSFSSSKTSSRKPYTSSKQQERHEHIVEITLNVSGSKRQTVSAYRQQLRAVHPVRRAVTYKQKGERGWIQFPLNWRSFMVPQKIFGRSYLFVSDFYIYIYIYIYI